MKTKLTEAQARVLRALRIGCYIEQHKHDNLLCEPSNCDCIGRIPDATLTVLQARRYVEGRSFLSGDGDSCVLVQDTALGLTALAEYDKGGDA